MRIWLGCDNHIADLAPILQIALGLTRPIYLNCYKTAIMLRFLTGQPTGEMYISANTKLHKNAPKR
jgi:hypothetical protein